VARRSRGRSLLSIHGCELTSFPAKVQRRRGLKFSVNAHPNHSPAPFALKLVAVSILALAFSVMGPGRVEQGEAVLDQSVPESIPVEYSSAGAGEPAEEEATPRTSSDAVPQVPSSLPVHESMEVPPEVPKIAVVHVPDRVVEYLWSVYQRSPSKQDSHGDFTWKDGAAAERLGMSVQTYVIGGIDPDFREQLFHAGQAMDAAGISWTILSGFRDDFRQSIAVGFKAHPGRSFAPSMEGPR
jgi:hypothetical protein